MTLRVAPAATPGPSSDAAAPPAATRPTPIPAPALRRHELTSRVFGNTRTLRVLLPSDYDEAANRSRTYPVLYLNDGQNLFDATTSMFGPYEWQVDETITRLRAEKRIEPIIVVGIDNAGRRQRPVEYLPYPDEFLHPPTPRTEGKKYPEFLIDEVIPFIRRTYRTRVEPGAAGIGGSSYGAVAALFAAMSHPEVFGRLLLESPSLYISDERLLKDAARVKKWPERVYAGVGTRETGEDSTDREAVSLVEKLARILENAGLGDRRLLVVVDPGGIHREDAWARRLGRALEFLYGH